MTEQGILLISQGNFEKDFLSKIAWDIGNEIRMPVLLEEFRFELNDFYDPVRRQYDGNGLLKIIDSYSSAANVKKIGLFRVDLFIPVLTYIFGQAVLNGNSGIASLYRLRNEQYGMKKDDSLLFERLKKVITHELGHTFGLLHCHNPACVMRSSTYVEDIDQKKHGFCTVCRSKITAI